MFVREARGHSPARGAIQESDLEQIWFDHLFDRIFFFVQGSRKRSESDRAAVELLDNCHQKLPIHLIKAVGVDFHPIERIIRDFSGDASVMIYLGVIPDATQESIGDARSSARTLCQLRRAGRFDFGAARLGFAAAFFFTALSAGALAGAFVFATARCGDFAVDVARRAPGFAFRCRCCDADWQWRPGAAWPVSVVRPRAAGRPAARPGLRPT